MMTVIATCEVCERLSPNDVRHVVRNGEAFAACKSCRFKYLGAHEFGEFGPDEAPAVIVRGKGDGQASSIPRPA